MADVWIAGLSTGHNASTCLLKNGEIVFYIEEERLSRQKYDDSPFLGILKIKEYTDKLDYLAISNGPPYSTIDENNPFVKLALKLGLISSPNFVFASASHHTYHAASGFYSSGFDSAVCVVIDAAGSYIEKDKEGSSGVEIESIYHVEYPAKFKSIWKRCGNTFNKDTTRLNETFFVSEPGIAAMYSALSMSMGHSNLECGKVMGLASYGKPDDTIPPIFVDINGQRSPNRNLFRANLKNYPLPSMDNIQEYNRENLCYAVQQATQSAATDIILRALKETGSKKLVISGGYALNCVANYEYLKHVPSDVEIFIDPPAYDGGQSIGVAKLAYNHLNRVTTPNKAQTSYCIGPQPKIDNVEELLNESEQSLTVDYKDVVKLLVKGDPVGIFQGGSEAGPRALGNRSILFDPRVKDGKDIVNKIKGREWYRPFAGSVLREYAHQWFDMRGLAESPFMMYAVDVLKERRGEIPSVVHVDGTCRVQTVGPEQNLHFYNLIKEFLNQTGVPLLFNTSFNLAGDPIVETLEDALDTLRRSKLEYLYLPDANLLITGKNI